MQEITITGRLGRDASVKETQNGTRFMSFPVACDSKWRGAEKTTWYDVMSFDIEKYQRMMEYLKKGTAVIVIGELDARTSTDQDGKEWLRLNVTADKITFLGGGSSNSGHTQDDKSEPSDEMPDTMASKKKEVKKVSVTAPSPAEYSASSEDDLPF